MKKENRIIGNYPALIHHPCDESGWKFVIVYDGENGAVISDVSLEKAESKFLEAMNLGNAVYKLMYFSQFGHFPVQAN